MREGLRSNASRQKEERQMLDLNKEPSENKMPSAPSQSSTDYFSAPEDRRDVDSSVSMEVPGNAGADYVQQEDGVVRMEENDAKSTVGENSEDAAGRGESHCPSSNGGLIVEQASEPEPVECGSNAADVGVTGGAGVSGETIVKKRRGRKRKVVASEVSGDGAVRMEENNTKSSGGENSEGTVRRGESHFPLTNGGLIVEQASEPEPVKCCSNAADVGASGGAGISEETIVKKRRGRKRKVVAGGVSGDGGVRMEENNAKSSGGENSEDAAARGESQFPSTNGGLIVEQARELEPVECGSNAADVGASAGAGISGETIVKKRGRKRKVVAGGVSGGVGMEQVSLNEDSAKMAKIREGESTNEVLERVSDADMGGNVAADTGCSTGEARKETGKGRRGRKRKVLEAPRDAEIREDGGKGDEKLAMEARPQIPGRVLRSRTIASTGGVNQPAAEENAEDKEDKLNADRSGITIIDRSVQSVRRGRKIAKKGRRGRPPKVQGMNGNLKVAPRRGRPPKVQGIKLGRPKAVKVKKHNGKVKSDMPKPQGEKSNHKNEGEMRRSTEKQLLRNRIISILMDAGWTIQYRPRSSKEYLDAVYVDHQGRTYWSCTLAYKKLREMVESRTADAKEVSGFAQIPEEELSKLYRITKEKEKRSKKLPKAGRSKAGEGHDKTAIAGGTALSNCKANSNTMTHLGEKLSRKKKVDISEQGVLSGRRKSKSRKEGEGKPRALLARRLANDHPDGFEIYKGKRNLLSWMIDSGTLSLGAKVQYMDHERKALLLDGRITSEGIFCNCCSKVVTLADFESHSGSSLGQPCENIYLESGQSLLQCIRELWDKQQKTYSLGFHQVNVDVATGADPHDDTCSICADGGDLSCCDGCSSTFHHGCLQMEHKPVGYWRCVHCSCKFCGMAFSVEFCEKIYEIAAVRDDAPGMDDPPVMECASCTDDAPGVDDPPVTECASCTDDPPSTECAPTDDPPATDNAPGTGNATGADNETDMEETPDKKDVAPVLRDYMDDYERFRCYFCEEIFHAHCRSEKDAVDNHCMERSFCGRGCQKLSEDLQKLVGVRHELGAGYSWTILQHRNDSLDVVGNADPSNVICNLKLALALSILDECFEPITDERSNINVIQSVIYSCGSNLRRLNFRWFYTFILERGDELVSAAAVRSVHGNQVAEMPFIGTRLIYRRQGMCRRLLTAVELALSYLNVEKLVIPAVAEVRETWSKVFGFLPLEELERQEMKYMSLIAFPGTDMMQKPMCTEGQTSIMGREVSTPTTVLVNGATTPCNLDASTADNLEENVETAAVGSGGMKRNCVVLVA